MRTASPGEHQELHALWTILTQNKKGYSKHPETLRWYGKQKALYLRHEVLVREMTQRGYNHHSNLNKRFATGSAKQMEFVHGISEQNEILRKKNCECKI